MRIRFSNSEHTLLIKVSWVRRDLGLVFLHLPLLILVLIGFNIRQELLKIKKCFDCSSGLLNPNLDDWFG